VLVQLSANAMKIGPLVVGLALLVATTAGAAVPRTISYQGSLAETSSRPVNRTVTLAFSLYTTASGGSPVWTEAHPSVAVSHGRFVVRLGSVTPLALPFDRPYYLGVTIDAGPEMTPRHALTSAGRSVRAGQTSAFVSGAVTADAIQAGTVGPATLANSCAVGQILVRAAAGWECGTRP
jgi:hypothetical protein